jgi:hypothetical protein
MYRKSSFHILIRDIMYKKVPFCIHNEFIMYRKVLFSIHDRSIMYRKRVICTFKTICSFHAQIVSDFVHEVSFLHNGYASDSAKAQKIPQLMQPTAALITNNTKVK